ncbi:MAG TPA: hypothetical protein VFC43_07320 [Methanoregula sp.]|nr:hypothetical protein [Methanoregula sp.]
MTNPFVRALVCLLVLCAIIIIPPASSVTLSPGNSFAGAPTIANGDPVFIDGIATGHPANGLQVWLLGYNYVKISSVYTNTDNTYEFELKSADTQNLAPGQYYVLVQHPMMNGEFDIFIDASKGSVINRQLGTGTSIFQLTGTGSLQTPDGANALMRAINSQNLDDTFATTSFIIRNPTAFIDPIGDHAVGDKFTITGSTNLAAGNNLLVEITSSSFRPSQKSQSGEFSGSSGTVTIDPGSGGMNRWSFDVDASTFRPDEYLVKISGTVIEVAGSTTFNIFEKLPATVKTPVPSTSVPAVSLTQTTPPPSPVSTTQKSPTSPLGIIAAIAVVAGFLRTKRK